MQVICPVCIILFDLITLATYPALSYGAPHCAPAHSELQIFCPALLIPNTLNLRSVLMKQQVHSLYLESPDAHIF